MWHDMFVEQIPIAEKLLRTVLVYALIAVLIRLSGKRSLAGLNTLDFVVMFLLSNVVQNSIIGNDLSVTGGVIGATTLVLVDWALNRLSVRSPAFSRLFNGTQTVVVAKGKVVWKAVHKLGMRREELEQAVRQQNGDDLSDVETAFLEPSGHLIVTLRRSEQGATKADIERLTAQLERIEAAVAATR